jgi:hypothetical protein
VLLGIKYEAAKIGGVGEAALADIEGQIEEELGAGWRSDEQVLRGRNAVRREHGLPGLGDPGDGPSPTAAGARRPLWRRVLGR